jgi:hypothetical protein
MVTTTMMMMMMMMMMIPPLHYCHYCHYQHHLHLQLQPVKYSDLTRISTYNPLLMSPNMAVTTQDS